MNAFVSSAIKSRAAQSSKMAWAAYKTVKYAALVPLG